MIELKPKPPFRFVGNKSNRRDDIIDAIEALLPSCHAVCDLFAGSMYCSHLVSHVASKLDVPTDIYINDYDGYSKLFDGGFHKALSELHGIVSKTKVKRDEFLEQPIINEIDALIDKYDKYRRFLLNYLSMYGNTSKYRRRTSVPDSIKLGEYILPKLILHEDYAMFIEKIASVRESNGQTNVPYLWICDPPYHSSTAKVNYKGTVDIQPQDYCTKIIDKFKNDIIINFSYHKSLQIKDYSVKLDNIFVRPSGGVAKTSKMEYTHIIRNHNE